MAIEHATSLREKIEIVNAIYNRMPSMNLMARELETLDQSVVAALDLDAMKADLVAGIDGIISAQRQSGHNPPLTLSNEQKNTIAELAVEGIVRKHTGARGALLLYLESIGFTFAPRQGRNCLLTFWSGDGEEYKRVLNSKLRPEGVSVASDFDITALDFVHSLRHRISNYAHRNPEGGEISRAAAEGNMEIIGYLSSIYAAHTQERGGVVYVLSRKGLKVNSYFWAAELPVLKMLQRQGRIGEIRILHQSPAEYEELPLAEIGSPLVEGDVDVIADYRHVPEWLVNHSIIDQYNRWVNEVASPKLIELLNESMNYIYTHADSARLSAMKVLTGKVIAKLQNLSLDFYSSQQQVDSIRDIYRSAQPLLTEGNFISLARNIFQREGASYKKIKSILTECNDILRRPAFKLPSSSNPNIALPFRTGVIARRENVLKRLMPFNLLRELWHIEVDISSTNPTEMTLRTAAGKRCLVRFDMPDNIFSGPNRVKQIHTLERFILSNFTAEDMPEQLLCDGQRISSGEQQLALRLPDDETSGFVWEVDREAVSAVRTASNHRQSAGESSSRSRGRGRSRIDQLTLVDAVSQLKQILSNSELQALRTSSLGTSDAVAQRISMLLLQNNIAFDVRMLQLWRNERDFEPLQHYVIIAKLGGHKIAIDLCARKFAGPEQSTTAIISNIKSWEEKFLALDQVRSKAVNYRDFDNTNVVRQALVNDARWHGQLTDPTWSILGRPPLDFELLLKYPAWGTKYLEFYQQAARMGQRDISTEQQQELDGLWRAYPEQMEEIEYDLRSLVRYLVMKLWKRDELIAQIGRISATPIESALVMLDNYHGEITRLTAAEKIETLHNFASELERLSRTGYPAAALLRQWADEARNHAMVQYLYGQWGALGAVVDTEDGWREPALDALRHIISSAHESHQMENYQRQLIVQLDGDDYCFEAAKNIFSKSPRHSEWMQLNVDVSIAAALGWNEQTSLVQSGAPLQLDTEGRVRIVLVGHGRRANGATLFGSRNAEQLQIELDALFARVPAEKIRGIHLDLLGCNLANRQSSHELSLPSEVADWLQCQAELLGIAPEHISLSAREYPVRVNASGKKEILTEEYGWINKESARLRDLLHKVEWRWDPDVQKMTPRYVQLESLLEVGRDIESVVHHAAVSDAERAALVELHQQVGDDVRQRLLGEQAPDAAHRGSVSAYAVENIAAIHRAEQWSIAVQTLKQRESLDASWLATVQVRRSRAEGGMEIRFIKRDTGEVRWVRDENPIFSQFYDISHMTAHLVNAFRWSAAENRLVVRSNLEPSRGVNSLNAAFMLQTLMSVNPRNGGLNAVSDAAKVQIYSQLVQNSVGLADDAAQLVGLIRSALGTEWSLAARGTELMSRVAGVANPVLDAVNIAATVVELQQTSDPTARAVIEARLGTSVVMSGLNIASLIAGLTGAGAAAAGLSALAVPLTGLAVGLPALVENYQRLRQGFDQASQRLDAIANSIESAGFHLEHGIWQLNPGAVVDRIDFRNGQLHYGSVEINATKGGSANTVTGGWDHYFARPDPDTHRWLDVYAGLGLAREQAFSLDASQPNLPVLLPAAISRRLTFDYQQVTGRRTASAPAMDRLRAYFGTDFVPRMYAFPTDWAIYRLDETRRSTAIEVNLDGSARSLIMPTVADADDRGLLSYTLNGGGGAYAVVLPANPLNLRVEASGNVQERWIFDVDYALKQHSIQDGRVVLGELKPQVFSGLRIENNSISIGGHTVSFQGVNRPAAVLLRHRIGDGAQICLNVDLAGRRYESSLLLNETPEGASLTQLQQFFSSSDAQILLRNGRIAMVVGSEAGEIEVASGLSAILPFRLSAPETEGSGLPNANMNSQRLAHAMTGLSSPDAGADVLRTVDASRSTPMLTHTI